MTPEKLKEIIKQAVASQAGAVTEQGITSAIQAILSANFRKPVELVCHVGNSVVVCGVFRGKNRVEAVYWLPSHLCQRRLTMEQRREIMRLSSLDRIDRRNTPK